MTNLPSMNHPATSTVEFRGAQLITIKQDDIEYVAMRPVVEAIGLNWSTQKDKLQRNKTKFSCTLIGSTGKDGKAYNMLCIPITKFNGWAFSINTERIPAPEVRKRVELYQEECFLALYNYWHKGIAERKVDLPETLTPSEQHEISQAVKLKAESNGKAIPEIWGRIKNKFKVAKYNQIRRENFQDVMDYISAMEIRTLFRTEEKRQPEPDRFTPEEKRVLLDDVYENIREIRASADNIINFYREMNKLLNKIGNVISILNAVDYKERRIREMGMAR